MVVFRADLLIAHDEFEYELRLSRKIVSKRGRPHDEPIVVTFHSPTTHGALPPAMALGED